MKMLLFIAIAFMAVCCTSASPKSGKPRYILVYDLCKPSHEWLADIVKKYPKLFDTADVYIMGLSFGGGAILDTNYINTHNE